MKEIGAQATSQNASLDEIKSCMICLQMARHGLIDPEFRRVVTHTMEKVTVKQKKFRGVLTLSQLFSNSKLNGSELYWCNEIVNSFPIFSGAVICSLNTKHGKNAKDINSAIEKMYVGKTDHSIIDNKQKEVLKNLHDSFETQHWGLVNKYIINYNGTTKILRTNKIRKDTIVSKLRKKINETMSNDQSHRDKIIQLMAHVFVFGRC